MKKSVKRIVSFVSAIAMLSTTAMAVSAAEAITVGEANSICVSGATDFTNVKADVFVIKSATDKLERAALNILKEQFGTKTADKNAIINAASKMSEKELKAAVENAESGKGGEDSGRRIDGAGEKRCSSRHGGQPACL